MQIKPEMFLFPSDSFEIEKCDLQRLKGWIFIIPFPLKDNYGQKQMFVFFEQRIGKV